MKRTNFFLVILFCIGCSKGADKSLLFSSQEIFGREELLSWKNRIRSPVYHAKVPLNWKRIDIPEEPSLNNPAKPIASFLLEENLILHFHSFPAHSIDERIAPEVFIEQWSRQFSTSDVEIEPLTHHNFSGYSFRGNQRELSLLAWAFQLEIEDLQNLYLSAQTTEEEEHCKQMGANIIIFIVGSCDLIEKHREDILFFVTHWNLIQKNN